MKERYLLKNIQLQIKLEAYSVCRKKLVEVIFKNFFSRGRENTPENNV